MALRYNTKVFVLAKKDIRESDQIFTVFTEDFGKIEVLGKGIRKIASKLRPNIDIFSLCQIEFIQGKAYKTLTDSFKIKSFLNIKRDLQKIRTAFKILKAIEDFIKGQETDREIWELLEETFEKLDGCDKHQLAYYYFLWNLLAASGYKIDLYNCADCRKKLLPQNLCFNIKEKSIIDCKKDYDNSQFLSISPETIKLMRIFLKKDWKTLLLLKNEKKEIESLEKFSNCFLSVY